MKSILVSVLFMICLSTFSQNTKFSIGIEGSPTYNNILFSTGKENVDNSIKEIFRPKLGFTVGAPINYEITKGLSISSGLYWTNRGHLREEYLEHYPTDWSENPDYVNVNQKITVNQQFLEIPLGVRIRILNKENSLLYSTFGMTANIPIIEKTKVYTYFPDHTRIYLFDVEPHEKNFKSTYISCYAGLGFEYRVGSKIGLTIEPYFNYMFGGPELFSDVNWLHSYFIACKIGAKYYL